MMRRQAAMMDAAPAAAAKRAALRAPSSGGYLLIVLLVCSIFLGRIGHAAAQSTSAPAGGSTVTASRAKRKNSCPNARECGLVTQAELYELALDVTFIDAYLNAVSGAVTAIATISPNKDTCDSVDQSQAVDFAVECSQEIEVDPPDIRLTSTCPSGFTAAVETVCWGEILDARDQVVGRLPLLESGAFSGTAYCSLATVSSDGNALPPDSRVRVTQLIKCSFYEQDGQGAGKKGARAMRVVSNAAGAELAKQVKARRASSSSSLSSPSLAAG